MTSEKMKGMVYNLQRFAVHDGPGIRTLVYMKGCPLKCLWCSSPHTQKRTPEILHIETNCRACGLCVDICKGNAVSFSREEGPHIDRTRCLSCGFCVEACPGQARELAGKLMTPEELFEEVDKDSPFYRRSNGGATVGGGEPTLQYEFVKEFLKLCKKRYVHTVMETCGFVKWEHFEGLLEYLDLVYMDIKHMDPGVHKEITGVSNDIILENARRASALRPMIIRIPVVPGLNDAEENISATARFAAELGENLKRIDLLPYHKFGTQTYGRLGKTYTLEDVEPPDDARMQALKNIVESCGVAAQIGG
jgi:pyruvate formate lyase activating enzyme